MSPVIPATISDAEAGRGWLAAATAGRAQGLANVVARLQTSASELAASLPEPADGSSWAQLDAALHALHTALAALRALDGPPPAPRADACSASLVSEPPIRAEL